MDAAGYAGDLKVGEVYRGVDAECFVLYGPFESGRDFGFVKESILWCEFKLAVEVALEDNLTFGTRSLYQSPVDPSSSPT